MSRALAGPGLSRSRLGAQRGALNTVNPTVHSAFSHRIEKESVMHMLDWNKYRQQLLAGVGGLANVQLTPAAGPGAALAISHLVRPDKVITVTG